MSEIKVTTFQSGPFTFAIAEVQGTEFPIRAIGISRYNLNDADLVKRDRNGLPILLNERGRIIPRKRNGTPTQAGGKKVYLLPYDPEFGRKIAVARAKKALKKGNFNNFTIFETTDTVDFDFKAAPATAPSKIESIVAAAAS